VDNATDYCWSYVLKSKDKTAKIMTDLDKHLKDMDGKTVETIQCDNARENKAFQELAAEQRLGLQFEYTSHKTPQQNG